MSATHPVGWLRRSVSAGHVVLGATLLLRPNLVARVAGDPDTVPARSIVRFLGARSLLEGLAIALVPGRPTLELAALTDGLHALSMVPVAVLTRYHRTAGVSALVATAQAGAEVAALRATL